MDGLTGSCRKRRYSFACNEWRRCSFTTTLLSFNLGGQPAEPCLIGAGRRAHRQLVAEVAGQRLLQAHGGLVVQFAVLLDDAVRLGKLLLGEGLHPNEQPATLAIPSGPLLDVLVKLPPSAQVEVPNAEIRPV